MYYRDTEKVEVDVVIENAKGQLVGVEVKAAATVKASDFNGLKNSPPWLEINSKWVFYFMTVKRRYLWMMACGQHPFQRSGASHSSLAQFI
ncbi:hypothetical protein MCEGE14_02901 [Burkholderiaceae bacterium]